MQHETTNLAREGAFLDLSCGYKACLESEGGFRSPYSKAQHEAIVALCERFAGKSFSNGPCVRLDSVTRGCDGRALLLCSQVGFVDFVITNYAWDNRCELAEIASSVAENDALSALVETMARCSDPGFMEILGLNALSNIVSISLLIRDLSGNVLLTRRSSKVGISSGFASVSATGVVEPADLELPLPLEEAACRECREELGIRIEPEAMRVSGLYCGASKLQPVAIVDTKVDDLHAFREIVEESSAANDFYFENSSYRVCSREEARKVLADPEVRMTEAGRFHLRRACMES